MIVFMYFRYSVIFRIVFSDHDASPASMLKCLKEVLYLLNSKYLFKLLFHHMLQFHSPLYST